MYKSAASYMELLSKCFGPSLAELQVRQNRCWMASFTLKMINERIMTLTPSLSINK